MKNESDVIIKNVTKKLIVLAESTYGKIFPCGEKKRIKDCVTYEKSLGKVFLWFNTANSKSTSVVTIKIDGE